MPDIEPVLHAARCVGRCKQPIWFIEEPALDDGTERSPASAMSCLCGESTLTADGTMGGSARAVPDAALQAFIRQDQRRPQATLERRP